MVKRIFWAMCLLALVTGCRDWQKRQPSGIVTFGQDDVLRVYYVRMRDFLTGKRESHNPDRPGVASVEYIYTGEAWFSVKLGDVAVDAEGNVTCPMPTIAKGDLRISDVKFFDSDRKGVSSRVLDNMKKNCRKEADLKFREEVMGGPDFDAAKKAALEAIQCMIGDDRTVKFIEEAIK